MNVFTVKLLHDVTFSSLHGHCGIPTFNIPKIQLDDYPPQQNFSNPFKQKRRTTNYIKKIFFLISYLV